MDFENNEKKQEETQNEGFQKEFRPGRSPRPRIHTGQRPAYEQRPNYRNTREEGGFRPEGFGAGCPWVLASIGMFFHCSA